MAGAAKTAPIIQHPDVKRMLLTMKASAEATRALAYQVSALLDRSRKHPDEAERRRCQALVDLLIPVVKGWSTETAFEVASLGVQVHGGMGYIEETGAAQHLRDARISTIYEGTTGIQANDLVGRKVGREAGRHDEGPHRTRCARSPPALAGGDDAELRAIGSRLAKAIDDLERATDWIVAVYATDPGAVAAGSVYYLKLVGLAGRRLDDGEGGARRARGSWRRARATRSSCAASGSRRASSPTTSCRRSIRSPSRSWRAGRS